ncbi:M16 family metallopeptidase [Candidatus Cloacimonadota bacterium]
MDISSYNLPNQLKVIYSKDSSNPLACIQLYVRVGSAWEEDEEAGLSHFTEHMVFKSTSKFPENSLSERITYLGGTVNAYTEYDSTCFYITIPSKYLLEALELISELARFAEFNKLDFDSEKKVIIEECKQFQNDPEDYFLEHIAADYFKYNPYRKPIIGEISKLKTLSVNNIADFYNKYYIPNNCFLVIAGDFTEDLLRNGIETYFGNWEKQDLDRRIPATESFPAHPAYKHYSKKINNDMLAFVLPDLADANPNSYPLSLISKAFAIGKKSRLYKRLYQKEKLVDSIRVHSLSGKNNGITIILINPKKKTSIEKIIDVFSQELRLFHEFGLNQSESGSCKKDMIYYYRYTYEYNESLASSLGSEELLSKYENFLNYPHKIQQLELNNINDVVRKYYSPEFLQVYHIGRTKTDSDIINGLLHKHSSPKTLSTGEKDIFIDSLPNGMKLIFKKVTGKPVVGISLTSEVSQLNEDIDQLGLNLLTSALLLYGNEKRNYEQLLNYSTENGIHAGISPKSETTSINVKCFMENLYVALELIADVILTPTFPKDHLDILKQTNLSNFSRIKDYPQYYATRLWKELIFSRKSNLFNSNGNSETIRRFTQKKVSDWYKRYYNYTDMTLAIVGDFDFDLTLNICKSLFPAAEKLNGRRKQIPIFKSEPERFKSRNKGLNQSYINIGGFGCNALDIEKNTAFHVMAQIIGGDMNSLLFNEIRDKLGLAYSVDFDFHSVRSLGHFLVTAIVDKKNESQTVDAIIAVLDEIKQNGITPYELEKTKNYIRGQRLLDEESVLSKAQTLSILESLGFGYEYYLNRDKRLNNVNIDQIHQLAGEYFNRDDYFIHILS